MAAVNDLSQVGLSIDGRTRDASRDGEFLVIEEKPELEAGLTFGRITGINVNKTVHRNAVLTCGRYEVNGWHGLMGELLREQRARIASGERFKGFAAEYLNAGSGDTVFGYLLISAAPAINEASTEAPMQWKLIWCDASDDYGTGPG